MLGGQEIHLERGGIGGNNQLYRVEDLDGRCYALKSYFDDAHDPRDRIGTECKALAFAWTHGLRRRYRTGYPSKSAYASPLNGSANTRAALRYPSANATRSRIGFRLKFKTTFPVGLATFT